MPANAMVVRDAVERALAGNPAGAGVDVEDVSVTKAGRRDLVRVVLDRDGGIDLDAVAELSRVIAEALDAPEAAAAFDGAYVLEVSSPGVDRPLREPRHWRRARSRLVEVTLADGTRFTGRLIASTDADATLEVDGTPRVIALGDVASAIVQVEFNRPGDAEDDAADDAADEAAAEADGEAADEEGER